MVRLETVLDSWKTVRHDTIQAVEDFPATDFDFKPAPELMSFRDTARHILEAGHALTGMLLAGERSFNAPDFRQKLAQHMPGVAPDAAPATLAAELRGRLDERLAELASLPPGFFAETIRRMDGQEVTRLEMLQFVKEHELTHRAALFLYLRLKGIVPVTTRRRQAKQSGK